MIKETLKKVRALISHENGQTGGAGIEIMPDDIFLVSYPKSGNTWARFMLSYCMFDGLNEGDVDFATMEKYVPDIYVKKPAPDLPRPRVIKSHETYTNKYPKVIYMLRDGRDVAVSYYYHMTQRKQFNGTFSEFIRTEVPFGTWAGHVKGWTTPHPPQNIMLVKYEDMKAAPFEMLKKMIEFIGKPITDEKLRKAIEWSSFQKMKKIEQEKGLPDYFNAKGQEFVRKGVVGGWQDEFSPEDLEFFLKQGAREVLERFDYSV